MDMPQCGRSGFAQMRDDPRHQAGTRSGTLAGPSRPDLERGRPDRLRHMPSATPVRLLPNALRHLPRCATVVTVLPPVLAVPFPLGVRHAAPRLRGPRSGPAATAAWPGRVADHADPPTTGEVDAVRRETPGRHRRPGPLAACPVRTGPAPAGRPGRASRPAPRRPPGSVPPPHVPRGPVIPPPLARRQEPRPGSLLSRVGSAEWDLLTDQAVWSGELYAILGRDPRAARSPWTNCPRWCMSRTSRCSPRWSRAASSTAGPSTASSGWPARTAVCAPSI